MARVVRLLSCLVGVSTAFIVLASSAWAHVTVNAVDATQGAYTVLTFQVPTESDTASTVGVQVELPEATPWPRCWISRIPAGRSAPKPSG